MTLSLLEVPPISLFPEYSTPFYRRNQTIRTSTEEKRSLVARYQAGESVAEICADTGVPQSTFYTWIKPYTVTMTDSGHAVSQQAFIKMKQKLQKLEQMIEILQKVNCTVSAPLQEKLQELAKLHGQYSVHALCEALCVSRGTFYNHIFRRKEVTAYDKRRAEMKEHIQTAFDESQQRFGANKIAAVLADRGVRTSPKYVAELMREMGLQSVSIYSKRDYQKSERLAKNKTSYSVSSKWMTRTAFGSVTSLALRLMASISISA